MQLSRTPHNRTKHSAANPTVLFEHQPTPQPVSTIYCIGRNYADHAKELGNQVPTSEPVVFLKSRACLRGLESEPMAFAQTAFHHEVELVLYIGRDTFLGETLGWSAVSAIALGIDVTRRETQSELKTKGLPWTTAKSFAGSAIVGPFIPKSEFEGCEHFNFNLAVNDHIKQQGNTKMMLFDVPKILTFLASFNCLLHGDLIFTGTPAGVGPIGIGDRFTMTIEQPKRTWRGVF